MSKSLGIEEVKAEKREYIINAALEVFTQYGYDKASTSDIAKRAGIAKGSVFNYFGDKETLYIYLYDYSEERVKSYLLDKMNFSHPDIFYCIESYIPLLGQLLEQFPHMLAFIMKAKKEENLKIRDIILKKKAVMLEDFYSLISKDLDKNLFREGVDVDRAVDIILTTIENLLHRGECGEEINLYIKQLKIAFYS